MQHNNISGSDHLIIKIAAVVSIAGMASLCWWNCSLAQGISVLGTRWDLCLIQNQPWRRTLRADFWLLLLAEIDGSTGRAEYVREVAAL